MEVKEGRTQTTVDMSFNDQGVETSFNRRVRMDGESHSSDSRKATIENGLLVHYQITDSGYGYGAPSTWEYIYTYNEHGHIVEARTKQAGSNQADRGYEVYYTYY